MKLAIALSLLATTATAWEPGNFSKGTKVEVYVFFLAALLLCLRLFLVVVVSDRTVGTDTLA
jgi:hypothetical protein